MVKFDITAKTFSLVECNNQKETNDGDILCNTCYSCFYVLIHEPFIHEWKRYKNPNALDIECSHNHLKKYIEICPKAIMTVVSVIPKILCPICQDNESLVYVPYSTYDPKAILESFEANWPT